MLAAPKAQRTTAAAKPSSHGGPHAGRRWQFTAKRTAFSNRRSELHDATRCATVFVFSGQINAAQLVAPINDKADVDLRLFSKAELPEMLDAATQTCSSESTNHNGATT